MGCVSSHLKANVAPMSTKINISRSDLQKLEMTGIRVTIDVNKHTTVLLCCVKEQAYC